MATNDRAVEAFFRAPPMGSIEAMVEMSYFLSEVGLEPQAATAATMLVSFSALMRAKAEARADQPQKG